MGALGSTEDPPPPPPPHAETRGRASSRPRCRRGLESLMASQLLSRGRGQTRRPVGRGRSGRLPAGISQRSDIRYGLWREARIVPLLGPSAIAELTGWAPGTGQPREWLGGGTPAGSG